MLEDRTNALVVPSAAIQMGLQGSYVWTVDTDAKGVATARIQPVKVALAEGQVTILDSGLQPGQSVVVDGAERLRAGQIVTVSTARQRTGQGGARQGTGQSGGPSATPNAAAQPAAQPASVKHDKREQQ